MSHTCPCPCLCPFPCSCYILCVIDIFKGPSLVVFKLKLASWLHVSTSITLHVFPGTQQNLSDIFYFWTIRSHHPQLLPWLPAGRWGVLRPPGHSGPKADTPRRRQRRGPRTWPGSSSSRRTAKAPRPVLDRGSQPRSCCRTAWTTTSQTGMARTTGRTKTATFSKQCWTVKNVPLQWGTATHGALSGLRCHHLHKPRPQIPIKVTLLRSC